MWLEILDIKLIVSVTGFILGFVFSVIVNPIAYLPNFSAARKNWI